MMTGPKLLAGGCHSWDLSGSSLFADFTPSLCSLQTCQGMVTVKFRDAECRGLNTGTQKLMAYAHKFSEQPILGQQVEHRLSEFKVTLGHVSLPLATTVFQKSITTPGWLPSAMKLRGGQMARCLCLKRTRKVFCLKGEVVPPPHSNLWHSF